MQRIGVVGATGYTGFELLRLLSCHDSVELVLVTSEKYNEKNVSEVFPSLERYSSLKFQNFNEENCKNLDLIFCCLPHKVSMNIVPSLLKLGSKVVDFSADYRLKDKSVYESWYEIEHTSPDLISAAVYGMPELYRKEIQDSQLVANPGCYPTGAILSLVPLAKEGLINPSSIVIDAKSGVSGAGRKESLQFQFSEIEQGFKAYSIGNHRHTPEIEQELSNAFSSEVKITFTPHLIPVTRGIFSTIYFEASKGVEISLINETLSNFYEKENFVRIFQSQENLDISQVIGTNFVDMKVTFDKRTKKYIMVTVIDNLVKGASGAALQNMNIMLGIPETKGLPNAGFWI